MFTTMEDDGSIAHFGDGGSGPSPMALMIMQNLIKQATESQSKLSKEAMILIKSWPGDISDDRLTKLKRGHNLCQKNLTKLQYIKDFKELPDDMEATKENLDSLMSTLATHTSELNELIETTRGFVRAKRN